MKRSHMPSQGISDSRFHTSKEVLKPDGFQGNYTTKHIKKQEYMGTYRGYFITGDSNTQKDPV
ncbi:hypothetical protein LA10_06252, partial [Thermotoga neapolitana LA10]